MAVFFLVEWPLARGKLEFSGLSFLQSLKFLLTTIAFT